MKDKSKLNTEARSVSGVQEWADEHFNVEIGHCQYGCKYCYARSMAKRFKRKPRIRSDEEIGKTRFPKSTRRVMFPTTHDIYPANLDKCCKAIGMILGTPGRDVLIVSKADPECIGRICDDFSEQKDRILFRVTIGSASEEALAKWERGAPSFARRMEALKLAYERGFQTSVSGEPMLDADYGKVIEAVRPFVTDHVWAGIVNRPACCLWASGATGKELESLKQEISKLQSDADLKRLYAAYKDDPLVEWKDSLKVRFGLERVRFGHKRATETGLDIHNRG